MPTVNATWRLRQNLQTGQFTLIIEYKSDESPEEHEEITRRIVKQGLDLLRQYGLTDDQIKLTRIELPPPKPIPLIQSSTNSDQNRNTETQ